MDPTHDPLDGFSPELYVATLAAVAHADGLQPVERELLEQQARSFGVDLNRLPAVPDNLASLPWSTRVLLFRDAVTLSFADSVHLSTEESDHLRTLGNRLALPESTTKELHEWVFAHHSLLERLTQIIRGDAPRP